MGKYQKNWWIQAGFPLHALLAFLEAGLRASKESQKHSDDIDNLDNEQPEDEHSTHISHRIYCLFAFLENHSVCGYWVLSLSKKLILERWNLYTLKFNILHKFSLVT